MIPQHHETWRQLPPAKHGLNTVLQDRVIAWNAMLVRDPIDMASQGGKLRETDDTILVMLLERQGGGRRVYAARNGLEISYDSDLVFGDNDVPGGRLWRTIVEEIIGDLQVKAALARAYSGEGFVPTAIWVLQMANEFFLRETTP